MEHKTKSSWGALVQKMKRALDETELPNVDEILSEYKKEYLNARVNWSEEDIMAGIKDKLNKPFASSILEESFLFVSTNKQSAYWWKIHRALCASELAKFYKTFHN